MPIRVIYHEFVMRYFEWNKTWNMIFVAENMRIWNYSFMLELMANLVWNIKFRVLSQNQAFFHLFWIRSHFRSAFQGLRSGVSYPVPHSSSSSLYLRSQNFNVWNLFVLFDLSISISGLLRDFPVWAVEKECLGVRDGSAADWCENSPGLLLPHLWKGKNDYN